MHDDDDDGTPAQPPASEVDHGLVGLGLVMHLGGDLLLAAHLFLTAQLFLAGADHLPIYAYAYMICGVIRYAAYRSTGTTFMYGGSTSAFQGLVIYGAFALAQMAAVAQALRLARIEGATLGLALLAEIAWPGLLLLLAMQLRKRGKLRNVSRVGEGYGLDGVPVVMVVAGGLGTCLAAIALIVVVSGWSDRGGVPQTLALLAIALLAVRAAWHLVIGARGAFGADLVRFEDALRTWSRFARAAAVIAPLLAAAALWREAPDGWKAKAMLVTGALATMYALWAWPSSVRRVMNERHAGAWADDRAQPAYVASADRGLAALGWLLLGMGVLGTMGALQLLVAPAVVRDLPNFALGTAHLADASPYLPLALGGLQMWAGAEAAFASGRARMACLVAGVISAAAGVYGGWPVLHGLIGEGQRGGATSTLYSLAALTLALAVPLATVALALRPAVRTE